MKKVLYSSIATIVILFYSCDNEEANLGDSIDTNNVQSTQVEFDENQTAENTASRYFGPLPNRLLTKFTSVTTGDNSGSITEFYEYDNQDRLIKVTIENTSEDGEISKEEKRLEYNSYNQISKKIEKNFSDNTESILEYTYQDGFVASVTETSSVFKGKPGKEPEMFTSTTFYTKDGLQLSGENFIRAEFSENAEEGFRTDVTINYNRFGNQVLRETIKTNILTGEKGLTEEQERREVRHIGYTGIVINPFIYNTTDPLYPENRFYDYRFFTLLKSKNLDFGSPTFPEAPDFGANDIPDTEKETDTIPGSPDGFTPPEVDIINVIETDSEISIDALVDEDGFPLQVRRRILTNRESTPEGSTDTKTERLESMRILTYEFQ